MRCPLQPEKASHPLSLTPSLLEVETGSSGWIKDLSEMGQTSPIVNGKPEIAYF